MHEAIYQVGAIVVYLAAVGIALICGRFVLRRTARVGLAMVVTLVVFLTLLVALTAAGVPIPVMNG